MQTDLVAERSQNLTHLFMPIIYIDYNIIVKTVGMPAAPHAALWFAAIESLSSAGYRFALSAWHAYELAKSNQQEHVDACCGFVEAINPIWLSNSIFVKRAEIDHFLDLTFRNNCTAEKQVKDAAFNQVFSQMWATFGGEVIVGDTFRHMVQELRAEPGAIAEVNEAAAATPGAIMTGREALDDGRYEANLHIADLEYYKALVDQKETSALDFILNHRDQMLSMCPSIAIEDQLTQIRLHGQFKPTVSDAADLQHALAALAYCDYFVSDDKRLADHCRKAVQQCGLACSVHRNPTSIL